jgi:hypothetical protein
MDRRRVTSRIAGNVRSAIDAAGVSVHTVAEAADITSTDLIDRLDGRVEFEVDVLRGVGGFLRVPVTQLLEA